MLILTKITNANLFMKKTLLAFVILIEIFTFNNVSGQITVGKEGNAKVIEFEKGELDIIKNKATVFVNDDFLLINSKAWLRKFGSSMLLR